MKRPRGVYVLCFLLVWSLFVDVARLPYIAAGLSHGEGPHGWFDRMTVALPFAAPFCALAALVGLWRLRRWATAAFGVWALLAAVQTGSLLLLAGALGGLQGAGWLLAGALWAATAGLLLALWFYVRRVIRMIAAQEEPHDRISG